MPSIEVASRYQPALLWPMIGYDRDGQPRITTITPTPIQVRWKWGRSVRLDTQGNTITIDATVKVNQDIPNGSLMWLGSLADWVANGNKGSTGKEICEVKSVQWTPDIKGRAVERELGLLRRTDTLPTPIP